MSSSTTRTQKSKSTPLRFAHPFFTTVPVAARPRTAFGRSMVDHIQGTLNRIPKHKGASLMTLADIVGPQGATDIEQAGTLRFHAVGDTGKSADTNDESGNLYDEISRLGKDGSHLTYAFPA